jgi:hypothetical protein
MKAMLHEVAATPSSQMMPEAPRLVFELRGEGASGTSCDEGVAATRRTP